MNPPRMSHPHQPARPAAATAATAAAPWAWQLARGQATTLAADAAPRWLLVNDGCVWVTGHGSSGDVADDIWLAAGQSLALPAGTAWVLEGWPQARVSLLVQAAAAAVRRGASAPPRWPRRGARWWRPAWLQSLAS